MVTWQREPRFPFSQVEDHTLDTLPESAVETRETSASPGKMKAQGPLAVDWSMRQSMPAGVERTVPSPLPGPAVMVRAAGERRTRSDTVVATVPKAAVMRATPIAIAVTLPLAESMVATPGASLLHTTARSVTTCPRRSLMIAASERAPPGIAVRGPDVRTAGPLVTDTSTAVISKSATGSATLVVVPGERRSGPTTCRSTTTPFISSARLKTTLQDRSCGLGASRSESARQAARFTGIGSACVAPPSSDRVCVPSNTEDPLRLR